MDIEEAHNLAESMPAKAQALDAKLTDILTEMEASYPYWNPNFKSSLPHKEEVGSVVSSQQRGDQVIIKYRENGAQVCRVDLIYTMNGGDPYEEWFRMPASLETNDTAVVKLPKGSTHYFINLIDENNFLVSYPLIDEVKRVRAKQKYSEIALSVD